MADLDRDQTAAVTAGPVDLFIEAGAGSGKTRVLTARFVSAVLGEPPYVACDPRALPTVTFTDKAAGELAERIRRALAAGGDASAARVLGEAWISTIHGMCSRILRQHAFAAGIDPQFTVLDQVQASVLEDIALEAAIEELVATTDDAAAVLDLYGYDTVVTAARSVRASIRALGMTIADIGTITPDRAVTRLAECAVVLEDLGQGILELRQTPSVTGNASVAAAAAKMIADALTAPTVDGCALTSALSTGGLRRVPTVEGHDELLEAVRECIGEGRAAAAQIGVRAHETAFLELLRLLEVHYSRLKRDRGALDFTDLEVEAARLLETRPEIADEYRSRFAMVMVDEYQDTNRLQARLIGHLTRDNLCTVGDENQSIYRFRHADVGVFRERSSRAAASQRLDTNYRTAAPLLEVTNRLFGQPALLGPGFMSLRPSADKSDVAAEYAGGLRFEARLIDWSEPKGRDPHEVEAECVAGRVSELIEAGVEPGAIAVLMRALARGRGTKVERALIARGIPAHLASGGAFFQCPEVAEARALLEVIDNVWDDAAMTVVLAGRLCGLSADALVRVRAHADEIAMGTGRRQSEAHLWEALASPGLGLADPDAGAVTRLLGAIGAARDLRGMRPLADTVLQPLLDLDADLMLFASGRGGARAWSNILKLARLAGEYEAASAGDLAGFLTYLGLREYHAPGEQEAILDGESDAVRVMSIHAAKGLEFPVVVLAGLGIGGEVPGIAIERIGERPLLGMELRTPDATLPTIGSQTVRSAASAAADEESVRLLYVGCTRAEESLTIITRTDPAKDAEGSLGGRVRQALGLGAAGSIPYGTTTVYGGTASVTLMQPPELGGEPAGAAAFVLTEPDDSPVERAPVPDIAVRTVPPAAEAPQQVSYSGLATYQRCPYRFFLTSVVHLPAPPAMQGGDALAFGSAVHAVLEGLRSPDAHTGEAVAAAARAASLERASVRRLHEAVAAYLASPVARAVFAADRVTREAPIAVPLGATVLAGAIDAIAWDDDRALIVDYKTGAAPLSGDEAAERYRLQGECYALAAFAVGAASVRVVFAELERGRETAYEYVQSDRERIEADVRAIVRRMAEEGYPSREDYERELCETCPGLGGMCPVTRPSDGGAG